MARIEKGQHLGASTEFKKNSTPWHKGKTGVYTEEQLARMTAANKLKALRGDKHPNWTGGNSKCIDCGKLLSSKKAQRCHKHAHNGDKAALWKGGVTTESRLQRVKFRKYVQGKIFARDNYTCQVCDQYGGSLQVDHLKSWKEYPELRFEESNCRTLCMACHYYVTFKKKMPLGTIWGHNLSRRIVQ